MNPDNFLYTKIIQKNSIVRTEVNRILSPLKDKIPKTRQKFLNADYPLGFINSGIKQLYAKFTQKSNEEDNYILTPDFFEIKKQVILVEQVYCEKIETSSKSFL